MEGPVSTQSLTMGNIALEVKREIITGTITTI
jgi:hypothetical protein